MSGRAGKLSPGVLAAAPEVHAQVNKQPTVGLLHSALTTWQALRVSGFQEDCANKKDHGRGWHRAVSQSLGRISAGEEAQAEGNHRYRGPAHTVTAEVVVTLAGHSQAVGGQLSQSLHVCPLTGPALCWWIFSHNRGSKSIIKNQ